MGQEFGHSFVGTSEGLIGYNQSVSGMCAGSTNGEESASRLTQIVGRFYFSAVVGPKALVFSWLSVRDEPYLLAVTTIAGHTCFSNMATYFIKPSRKASNSNLQR